MEKLLDKEKIILDLEVDKQVIAEGLQIFQEQAFDTISRLAEAQKEMERFSKKLSEELLLKSAELRKEQLQNWDLEYQTNKCEKRRQEAEKEAVRAAWIKDGEVEKLTVNLQHMLRNSTARRTKTVHFRTRKKSW